MKRRKTKHTVYLQEPVLRGKQLQIPCSWGPDNKYTFHIDINVCHNKVVAEIIWNLFREHGQTIELEW